MKPSIVIQQGTQSQIFEKAENWDFVRDAAPVIWKAAHITNVSASAIAGALLEENYSAGNKSSAFLDMMTQIAVDKYKQESPLPKEDEIVKRKDIIRKAFSPDPDEDFFTHNPIDEILSYIDLSEEEYKEWKKHIGKAGIITKYKNGYTRDVGPANVQIGTAVRLLQESPEEDLRKLGIQPYQGKDFKTRTFQLVHELLNDTDHISAKIYALYMREAEQYFQGKSLKKEYKHTGAYTGEWDKLPQEFRDALLIGYVNIGEKTINNNRLRFNENHVAYEPQPAAGTGAGVDHLYAAKRIGELMGQTGYGEGIAVADLATLAGQDNAEGLAARRALKHFQYIALPQRDYASEAEELALYDEKTGKGFITPEWIADRMSMLVTQMPGSSADDTRYFYDFEYRRNGNGEFVEFGEDTSKFDYGKSTNAGGIVAEDKGMTLFGKYNERNHLQGMSNEDHLYGGKGNDILAGNGGADSLEGGEGTDVYVLSVKDKGVDTIFDSDRKGHLMVDDTLLSRLEFVSTPEPFPSPMNMRWTPFRTRDGQYQFLKYDDDQWEFSVKNASGNYQPLARIRHWKEGDFGFTLAEDNSLLSEESGGFIDDSGKAVLFFYNGAMAPRGIRVKGSNNKPSQITGSAHDDVLFTGDGGTKGLHLVMAGLGNDFVYGGNNQEFIFSGNLHRDAINDNDTVYAGGGSDIVIGGAGADTLVAGNGKEDFEKPLPDDETSTETASRQGKRGDWLNGHFGSDVVIGSAQDDVLTAGEGDDTVRGGAGNDLILGDANYLPTTSSVSLGTMHGAAEGTIIEQRWPVDGSAPRPFDGSLSVPGEKTFAWEWQGTETDFKIMPGIRLMLQERVQGTGNDTLHGGAGNDWMAGQAGNDEVHGDDGDDTIFGDDAVAMPAVFASGDDNLFAGKGKDKLHGGAGNDVLDASDDDNDKDELSGDEGDDQLNGGTGGDELNGGADNDVLRAGKDKTLMDGGSGNDIYFSNSGDDTMTDQDGDDHYHISAGTDSIKDAAGYDGYHIMFSRLMPPGMTTIHDSDGKGFITYQGRKITHDSVRAVAENEWVTDTGAKLARDGSNLVITNGPKGSQGKVVFTGFFNSEEFLGLKLPSLDDDNKPSPDPKPDPKPQPEQPQAPTAGKPLAAQSVHEKEKLTYTLAEDTFHTANKDDKLTYSARLADGKPLPGWLSFNPQTRTFSGTPSNDDVGMLNVEISAKGKGGSANQRFTLNVINVNDAPQAGQKLPTLQIEHSKLFYYQLPEDAFKDIDKNDKLTFSATSENGQSLPSWLKFDAYNGTFTGSPSANTPQGNYRVTVTVTDSGGLKAHQTLVLNLAQGTPLKPVNGTDRNDVLISSADNELLAGKGGKDVYQFSRGFGHDLINNHDENSNQDDVVTFTNMNRKDFVIMRDYTSLYLRSLSETDELRIMGQFPANSKWRIGEIRFADGSILTADEIERELQKTTEGDDHIYGSKDNDIINGKGGNDVISGEEGDDELYGEDGNDNLIGSVGNDKLSGGAGEDSLNGGDGRDHLSGGAGNDELIGGEDDDQLHGNEGDDKLYGGTGNDLLIGDSGNDVLSGSAGNDIYRFARGFGHDVINNYDGGLGRHDSIDFSDMNRSDFDIRREGNNLVLHSKDGKNQITVTNHFFNGWQIDSIRFADGTTLDHGAINSAVSTQNAPRGNYMHPAAQALQMNQMIASLNNQAQPLHALAIPDEKHPVLAAVNPY